MNHDPAGRISLHNNPERVSVVADGILIADTRAAIELHETGYPVRQYIPRQDILMAHLVPSSTITHCPFKGDATYYSLELESGMIADAAWSYEQPFDAVAGIKGHLAFDARLVEERIGTGSD